MAAVYVEFGATSTDTVGLTFTYGSTTTAKTFSVLARQISCTAAWRLVTAVSSTGNNGSYCTTAAVQ